MFLRIRNFCSFAMLVCVILIPQVAFTAPYERIISAKYKTTSYLVFLPNNYEKEARPWPLFLYLHGAGERGNDLKKVLPSVPYKYANEQFLIVAPQCPSGSSWNTSTLNKFMNQILSQYNLDRSRLYITGYSMGGNGTWRMIGQYPSLFAAAAPAAGWGNTSDARKIAKLPIWAFHGKKDDVVPFSQTERMINAILKVKGIVKFTAFPQEGHGIWDDVYKNPDLYTWFLQQKK